jgi:hypothetical protein
VGGARTAGPMDDAVEQLGKSCGAQTSRLTMRDSGYEWKKRFFPGRDELQWRIEIRDYDCSPSGNNSQEIYRIPVQ